MKKLSLTLDNLLVESFATLSEPMPPKGTVRGHITYNGDCGPSNSCQWCATYTDCDTGYTNCGPDCGKDQPTQYWEVTCLPTCAGNTCDYDTCGACYSEVC